MDVSSAPMERLHKNPSRPRVRVTIHPAVIKDVFTECDSFEQDETGGRILGTYSEIAGGYEIKITGMIGPGPAARRTSTSFFQDGEYQENTFRILEIQHPEIEHLGNWHTHHVNGYPTLSGGDKETYRRIVNHPNHHPPFLYALLVTEKTSRLELDRYKHRHFITLKGHDGIFEIPSTSIAINENIGHLKIPSAEDETNRSAAPTLRISVPAGEIIKPVMEDLFPGFRPYYSKKAAGFYWRGSIDLLDGRRVGMAVIATEIDSSATFQVLLDDKSDPLRERIASVSNSSPYGAVYHAQQWLNRDLYERATAQLRSQETSVQPEK